jgi:hypothetical protein
LLLCLRNLTSQIWVHCIIFWGCRFPICLLIYLCLKLAISLTYLPRLICRIQNLVLLLVFLIITCSRMTTNHILIRSNTGALWEPCSISLSQGLILPFQWIKLASSCIIQWSLMLSQSNVFCDISKVPYILAFTFILVLFICRPTVMSTGLEILMTAGLSLVLLSILVPVLFLRLLRNNILFLVRLRRLNIALSLSLLQSLPGFVNCFVTFIFLYFFHL